jgi:AbrB family looped-hinge helix DNA binding protein
MWHTDAMRDAFAVRVGPKGRIVVPAPLRRELGMEEGADVVVRAEGERLVVEPRAVVLDRLRAVVRDAVPADVSLVDELLAARKEEARRERRPRRRR